MNSTNKIHKLMGLSADPCTYVPSEDIISNSLVGVEVELENINNLVIEDEKFHEYWRTVEDNSLRNGGMEYVLSRPFAGKDLVKALSLFEKCVVQVGHPIRLSHRTSVHIHIDVRELTYSQLLKFVSLYVIFEECLFNISGKDRANNLFSTSLSNAEGNISCLGKVGEDPKSIEAQNAIMSFSKYSACNLLAVSKYGSLEFRNHEGTYDVPRITKWINILLLLKEEATSSTTSTLEVFGNISAEGALTFFRKVFKGYSSELEYPELEFDMYNGLRLAQDITHSQRLDVGVEVPQEVLEDETQHMGHDESVSDKAPTSLFAKWYWATNPERYKSRYVSFASGETPMSRYLRGVRAIEELALDGVELFDDDDFGGDIEVDENF